MKVLFLITKATAGGAQKYVWDLVSHLPTDRFEPVVAYGEKGALSKKLEGAGIENHPLPSLGRDIALASDILSFFEILACLRQVRPDVLHLNSSKAAALGALAARMLGVKKIVFTVHGWPFNERRNEFVRVLLYLISWFTAFLSHTVIVVSKSDEVQGKRMRWVGHKVRYIPLGIEPPQFLTREEASAFLSIPSSALRIGTIAELTPNKGLRYAIEAIALLKEKGTTVSYTIIGEGEERAELEARAQELGIADRIAFKGFLHDASQYLKAFDIFLLPSVKEGMPYVLLEAIFADLPIVTTKVVDPDFVRRYSIHPIEAADAEALAASIRQAVGMRPHYREHMTFEKMAADTVALY